MKLTKACDYALRMMVYLTGLEKEEAICIRKLSESIDIPRSFLGNIVQKLANAGLVETVKGAKGGLRLARDPASISAYDVVKAVDGRLALSTCQQPNGCNHQGFCDIHPLINRLQLQIIETLESTSLDTLASADGGPGWATNALPLTGEA